MRRPWLPRWLRGDMAALSRVVWGECGPHFWDLLDCCFFRLYFQVLSSKRSTIVKFKLFSVSHECCDMTPGDVFEENIPEVVLLELLHIEVVDQILEIY